MHQNDHSVTYPALKIERIGVSQYEITLNTLMSGWYDMTIYVTKNSRRDLLLTNILDRQFWQS
jgi:hypothetical protein